jgi:C-terminal processing protease CtpA/Prc
MQIKLIQKILISLATFIMLIGCSTTPQNDTTFDESQKSFLYSLFKTQYLWYDKVTDDINYTSYQTPQEMIDDLKYSTYDKWSYAQTTEQYANFSTQTATGFGCYYLNNKIRAIRIASPCYNAGLKRGDIITKINYEDMSDERYKEAQKKLGTKSIFTIDRKGQKLNIGITPIKYSYKSTIRQIFTSLNGEKIGHMIFNRFSSASTDEIDEAFSYFKDNNIDELIIDLRYNGGGSLTTASILLDKIAGYNNENSMQAQLKWNNKNSKNDSIYHFSKDDNSLDLSRVFFLTSHDTASASEMVINCLKPYMDVKTIGSKTRGKPVGMRGRSKEGLIYWLINFSIYNANNVGDYYDGIDVDCDADDNIDFERIDKNEDMLKTALYYIDNATCN